MKKHIITLLLITTIMKHHYITTKDNMPNIFGTDGIRATVGTAPFTLSELPQLGYALGQWIIDGYGAGTTVFIGQDTRISCPFVANCIKSGLLLHDLNIVHLGVLPAPAIVQLTMQQSKRTCGIIVSASHNPFQDNGIKIVTHDRGKINAQDEHNITQYFYHATLQHQYTTLGNEQYCKEAIDTYSNHIKSFFPANFLKGKKIVLDCAHGATYYIAPRIFKEFGAEVITIGSTPTGTNINDSCGATDTKLLAHTVLAQHADLGFAFDGDGDRVIAVNQNGEIKDGDDILAVLLHHPAYQSSKTVIGTIMSNKGFEDWLNQKGYTLIRTPVGDKYIAQEMENNKELLLGGEQSGHIILRDYLPTGDGIFTALRIMETLIAENSFEMTMFKKMPQLLINIPIKIKKDLTQEPFKSMLNKAQQEVPHGRIIVRFSGTELKLRIMLEDNDEQLIESIGNRLVQIFQRELGS